MHYIVDIYSVNKVNHKLKHNPSEIGSIKDCDKLINLDDPYNFRLLVIALINFHCLDGRHVLQQIV